ncbi:MAG: acyltransferase [Caulobacter sp.]|nr:acyltransferase [Caulobacter sp.]
MARDIVGVQYLRGLAALAVVVDHSAATVANAKYFGAPVLDGLLYRGASGVDLFFLISGFIITVVSLDSDWRPKVRIADFFGRRFKRILPLMWIAIISWAVLRYVGRGVFPLQPYLMAMVVSPVGDLEPVGIWTLRHEFIFYTVFALTMLGPRWARPLLAIWCLSPFLMMGWEGPELLEKIAYPVNVEFGAGVLVGLAWLKRGGQFKISIEPFWLMVLGLIGLMFFGRLVDLTFHELPKTLMAAAFCAPILLFGVYVTCPPGVVSAIGLALGNASYAIYLFHPHAISSVTGILAKAAPQAPPGLVIVLVVVIATLAGYLAHLLIEKPILAFLQRPRRVGELGRPA